MDESRGKTFQEAIKIILKYIKARKNQRNGGKAERQEEGLEHLRNSGKKGRGKNAVKNEL